jgi:KaiC/GvpD/RAD55 family RecA-like ATPase
LRDKLLNEKKTPYVSIKSGIPGIDRACEGFRDGELIVISGPTKMGKTLLAQSFTVNFSKHKEYAGWFSYEVPARQFLDQFPVLPLLYYHKKIRRKILIGFRKDVLRHILNTTQEFSL